MKTLEEIYTEVSADEALKVRFQALKTPEEQAAFVKKLGGEATEEEIAAFLDKQNNKTGELSDEELDQVVGGKGSSAKRIHDNCGGEIKWKRINYVGVDAEGVYYCDKCNEQHEWPDDFAYHEE